MKLTPFTNFAFRIPSSPNSDITDALHNHRLFDKLVRSSWLASALYLASPTLYNQYCKYLDGSLNEKDAKRMKITLCKYLSRMSTRCTPFGMFACYGCGEWGEYTCMNISKATPRFRLDMAVLYNMFFHAQSDTDVRKKLKYNINPTLHIFNKQIRYYRYSERNGHRQYHLQLLGHNSIIEWILKDNGLAKIPSEWSNALCNAFDIAPAESMTFINNLIDMQILYSEIEPDALTSDYMSILCKTAINNISNISDTLGKINSCKNDITVDNIRAVESAAAEYGHNIKSVIQCDCFIENNTSCMTRGLADKIAVLFDPISRLCHMRGESPVLSGFKRRFEQRYQDQAVPLLEAIDPIIGVGYSVMVPLNNPLIDNIRFKGREGYYNGGTIGPIERLLLRKIATTQNKRCIRITDTDLKELGSISPRLAPKTISAMFSLVKDGDGQELIEGLHYIGPSAAQLIGRFAYGCDKTRKLVEQISDIDDIDPSVIHAEIAHLPGSHVGNIMTRPLTRKARICAGCYMSGDSLCDIAVKDLLIQLRNGKIVLFSKQDNKQIVPHMTSAHNYNLDTADLYKILCDLSHQNTQSMYGFSWGALSTVFDHFPRVMYGDVILSREKWRIKIDKKKQLKSSIEMSGMPQYVLLVAGDNKLLIDTASEFSMSILFSELKEGHHYLFEEYLIGNVHDRTSNKYYQNEFYIPFKVTT